MLLEAGLVAVTFGLALVLGGLALLSYRRSGERRLLFVALAFLVFLGKSAVLLAGLFLPALWAALAPAPAFLVLDLAVMAILYLAVAAT